MLPLRLVLFTLTLLTGAAPALADGTVLHATNCGDKVFVAGGNDTYSVLVTSEPGIAQDGDSLTGDIDRIGYGSFVVRRLGRRFSASVEERGLSRSEIAVRTAASCHAPSSAAQTSGQVERAAGCGNKIFVNTAQGYAVLGLLSGGVVAAGDTLTGNFSRAGRATLKNPRTGGEFVVFVDDFGLPKSAEARKVAEACR